MARETPEDHIPINDRLPIPPLYPASLTELRELSQKYGLDLDAVFDAIDTHNDLIHICWQEYHDAISLALSQRDQGHWEDSFTSSQEGAAQRTYLPPPDATESEPENSEDQKFCDRLLSVSPLPARGESSLDPSPSSQELEPKNASPRR